MIRHIVFFTAKNSEDRFKVMAGLSLLTRVPHALKLEIGQNLQSDQLGNVIEFVVYGEFENEAALAAYKAHPDYQASIDIVRPLREIRIAADYDQAFAVTEPIDHGG